ncbi:hypothetical protein ACH4WW_12945 [Streptomyces halstedii]|uniref:hypothetical protein n=1 Tax=Streptomyces halstedii TaxID=1944 RepID=UPI00378CCAD1
MSTGARRTRRIWAAGTVVAVLVLVAAGLHVYRNTNVLTQDRLCGGLVSTAKADAVLPGSGRLDARGDGVAEDLGDTVCTVERSSFLPGSGKGMLSVRLWEEDGDFPFVNSAWPDPSGATFFSGPVTGAVYESVGWALLPEKCWTTKPVFVKVSPGKSASGAGALAALTTDVARAVADEAACGDLPGEPGTLLPPRSDAARPVSEGRACGLDGFSVRDHVPADTEVLESGQSAPADLWSCTLFLDNDSRDTVRAEGFMTYAASRDPLLIAAVRRSPGASEGDAPGGGKADVVARTRIVLPCAQGALYLAAEPRAQYLEARKRKSGIPAWETYFGSFVKAATKTFDCGTATH